MSAQCTGDGGNTTNKHSPAGAVADVVEEAVKKAPAKDVGMFLKMVGVAIFLVALGVAISFVMRGTISVSATADAKVGTELDKMKEEASKVKKTDTPAISIEQKIDGVQPGTTVTKTVTVDKKD